MSNILPTTGLLRFSDIRGVFGGVNPIKMSNYFSNASSGLMLGVTGIPNTGSVIQFSQFRGKSKKSIISGATIVEILNALQPYVNEFKNSEFYNYNLDGTPIYIGDGGNDMYDTGNYTKLYMDGVLSPDLSYADTTGTSYVLNGKSVSAISLGYNTPLGYMAKSSATGNIGFQKNGDNGADGGGSQYGETIYAGTIVNGFVVHAWRRMVYAAGVDPSICDLYFAVGDSAASFTSSAITSFDASTNNGNSLFYIGGSNILVGCILLSKAAGAQVTTTECQTVLGALTSRLSAVSSSQQTPQQPVTGLQKIVNGVTYTLVMAHKAFDYNLLSTTTPGPSDTFFRNMFSVGYNTGLTSLSQVWNLANGDNYVNSSLFTLACTGYLLEAYNNTGAQFPVWASFDTPSHTWASLATTGAVYQSTALAISNTRLYSSVGTTTPVTPAHVAFLTTSKNTASTNPTDPFADDTGDFVFMGLSTAAYVDSDSYDITTFNVVNTGVTAIGIAMSDGSGIGNSMSNYHRRNSAYKHCTATSAGTPITSGRTHSHAGADFTGFFLIWARV